MDMTFMQQSTLVPSSPTTKHRTSATKLPTELWLMVLHYANLQKEPYRRKSLRVMSYFKPTHSEALSLLYKTVNLTRKTSGLFLQGIPTIGDNIAAFSRTTSIPLADPEPRSFRKALSKSNLKETWLHFNQAINSNENDLIRFSPGIIRENSSVLSQNLQEKEDPGKQTFLISLATRKPILDKLSHAFKTLNVNFLKLDDPATFAQLETGYACLQPRKRYSPPVDIPTMNSIMKRYSFCSLVQHLVITDVLTEESALQWNLLASSVCFNSMQHSPSLGHPRTFDQTQPFANLSQIQICRNSISGDKRSNRHDLLPFIGQATNPKQVCISIPYIKDGVTESDNFTSNRITNANRVIESLSICFANADFCIHAKDGDTYVAYLSKNPSSGHWRFFNTVTKESKPRSIPVFNQVRLIRQHIISQSKAATLDFIDANESVWLGGWGGLGCVSAMEALKSGVYQQPLYNGTTISDGGVIVSSELLQKVTLTSSKQKDALPCSVCKTFVGT